MRGVFDEQVEQRARVRRDKELTLGSGSLLAMVFVLVVLCGLCFGLGYVVGHQGAKPATAAASTAAIDQEPLQASGALPKPSAIAQDVAAPPAAAPDSGSGAATAPGSDAAPAGSAQNSAPGSSLAQGAAPDNQQPGQPQVHAALPAAANAPDAQQPAPAVRPAFMPATANPQAGNTQATIPQAAIMVQVAAVANPDDAEVLVSALRRRSYAVTARHDVSDNLIHVRVGPFATRAEAEQWRMRLLNDGYNAIIQP